MPPRLRLLEDTAAVREHIVAAVGQRSIPNPERIVLPKD